jgi:3D (Asp-Asp-Asp) domain-containing protein/peptidoglycan hydrolase CwlO-like protein
VVGSPVVRGPGRGLRTLGAALLSGASVGALLPAGGGAETARDLDAQADILRARNSTLAAGSQSALASLAAIESRLAQAKAEVASFRARSAQVRSRRLAVRRDLTIVQGALRATHEALAARLRMLYEEGDADVIAVILGAGSLDDALSAVETLDLAARQDEDLLHRARAASRALSRLNRALAARQRELDQLAAARAAAAASLADARAERLRTIAALRAARRENTGTIAALAERARTLASVQGAPRTPTATPGAPSLPAGPASSGVRSLTVVATAYALDGHTASGRPVGWGVVAVDPSVIPIGSRLAIPGYGMGVAADTGGAISGARIDVWFPTIAQAHAWGNRVVTVTVYPN